MSLVRDEAEVFRLVGKTAREHVCTYDNVCQFINDYLSAGLVEVDLPEALELYGRHRDLGFDHSIASRRVTRPLPTPFDLAPQMIASRCVLPWHCTVEDAHKYCDSFKEAQGEGPFPACMHGSLPVGECCLPAPKRIKHKLPKIRMIRDD